MKLNTYTIIGLITVSTLAGLVGCSTSTTKQPAPTAKPVTAQRSAMQAMLSTGPGGSGTFNNTSGTTPCCGSYTGAAKITNSATGTIWFTPPSGTTNCVITDSSGLSSPYVSVVQAMRRRDSASWCGTNTVLFPASSSEQYKFYIYIKNTPPPPTNGQVLTLDVQWQ